LKGLVNLSVLRLSHNKVVDIAPLAGLTKLSSLSMDHNQIRNIKPLEKIARLSTLRLNNNHVSDIGVLAKQTELAMLFLENNQIADLGPLVSAAKADDAGPKRFAPYLRLWLAGNPLGESAKSTQLAELKNCGVRIDPRD